MEVLRNLSILFVGFNREKNSEVINNEPTSMKRSLEEEEEMRSKDSLNHPMDDDNSYPDKRPRTSNSREMGTSCNSVNTTSTPVQTMFAKLKSWFSVKSSTGQVDCTPSPPHTIQAPPAPSTLYSAKLDTDEVELLRVEDDVTEEVKTVKIRTSIRKPEYIRDKLITTNIKVRVKKVRSSTQKMHLKTCPDCKKDISVDNFSRHIRETHERIKKRCPQCGKEFAMSNLLRHIRQVHTKESMECPYCDKTITISNLNKHIKSVHKKVKKTCERCCHCPLALQEKIARRSGLSEKSLDPEDVDTAISVAATPPSPEELVPTEEFTK